MLPPHSLDRWTAALSTCLWVVLAMGMAFLPGRAQATVFVPVAADLPATIPAPINNVASEITVAGVLSSISTITCSVYLSYPYVGNLAMTLTSPSGIVIPLADHDGLVDPGNNNGGGEAGGGGNGVVGGGATVGAQGSYGTGISAAPNGVVTFISGNQYPLIAAVNPGDSVIPSGNYQPITNTNQLFYLAGEFGPADTLLLGLASYRGLADNNVNGNWILTIYNFDDVFAGIEGLSGQQETGTLNYWCLTIDEVGPHIWSGATGTPNWSAQAGENWVNLNVPQVWEQKVLLEFPSSAGGNTNNDIGVLPIGGLTIAGTYNFTGDGVQLTGNAYIDNQGGTSVWNMATFLQTPPAGLLQIGGSTLQAIGPTFEVDTGTLTWAGNITSAAAPNGATITMQGPGELLFSGNNSYSGQTLITGGVLDCESANGIGGGASSGAVVSAGATLALGVAPPGVAANFAVNTAVTVTSTGYAGVGALEAVSGTITYSGQLTLTSSDAAVGAVTGSTLVLGGGALLGSGLTLEGLGTLELNETLPGLSLITMGGTIDLQMDNQVDVLGIYNGGTVQSLGGLFTLTVDQAIYSNDSATTNTFNSNLALGPGIIYAVVPYGPATPQLAIGGGSLIGPGTLTKTGAGNLSISNTNAPGTVPVTVAAGTLSGTANLASIAVAGGALLAPTQPMASVGDVSLAAGSVFVANMTGTNVGAALLTLGPVGNLNLSGAVGSGAGGAFLSPVGGGAGTHVLIAYGTLTPETVFVGRPDPSPGITYTPNQVVLTLDGSTVGLVTTAYTLSKGAGNVPIAVAWSTAPAPVVGNGDEADLVAIPGTAIQGQDFNQPTPTPLLPSVVPADFTLPIVQNYIAEGNTTLSLQLVPLGETTAVPASSQASVTIIDNQNGGYHTKNCGAGSGFTVFFLFAIGLMLRMFTLRRR